MYIQTFIRRRCCVVILIISSIFVFSIIIKPEYKIDYERIRNLLKLAENQSFCSERSARRGFNQHVLSVSAYESNDNAELKSNITWSFIKVFVNEAKKLYPSWIVRVYHYNLKDKTKNDFENLEKLHDNLDFCDVENLPVLGNLRHKLPGKMQRFLPASKSISDQ
jgi:hypothetical protein